MAAFCTGSAKSAARNNGSVASHIYLWQQNYLAARLGKYMKFNSCFNLKLSKLLVSLANIYAA